MYGGGMMRCGRKAIEREASRGGVPEGYIRTPYMHVDSANNLVYVQTGLKANVNDEYIVTCRRKADQNNRPVFGDGASKTDSNIALWLNDKTNLVEFTFGDGGNNAYKVLTTSYNVCEFHTYRMQCSTGKAWLDGNYIGQSQYKSGVTNPKNLVFFASWRGASPNGYFPGDVKEFIVIRNGVKIRHFVPVMQRDIWKPGFYDLCGSTSPLGTPGFYSNNGQTTFMMEGDPVVPDETADMQFDVYVDPDNLTYMFYRVQFKRPMKVDWGDGTYSTTGTAVYSTGGNNAISHTYAASGIYTVRIMALRVCSNGVSIGSPNSGQTGVINLRRLNLEGLEAADKCNGFLYCRNMRMGDRALDGTNPEHLPDHVFRECYTITPTRLPDSIMYIGTYAMTKCKRLQRLSKMPDGLLEIGTYAMYESSIGKISFGNRLRKIYAHAFHSCASFDTDALPATVVTIDGNAFNGCRSLSSLKRLPETLIRIYESSFRSCSNLALTKLPRDLEVIENNAFLGCSSLDVQSMFSIENVPKGLWFIGTYSFQDVFKDSIADIVFPAGLKEIQAGFNRCFGKSIVFTGVPETYANMTGSRFADVYVPWSEGDVPGFPWGMAYTRIHYDTDMTQYYANMANLKIFYDGIKNTANGHDASATTWTNLGMNTNRDLALDLDHCSVESDHLHLNGTGLAAVMQNNEKIWNLKAFEILYARGSTARDGIVAAGFDAYARYSCFFTNSDGEFGHFNGSKPATHGTFPIAAGEPSELQKSYSSNIYTLNGSDEDKIDKTESDVWFDTGADFPFCVGDVNTSAAGIPSTPADGDIYVIRFYSVSLYKSEAYHNYNLDRARYGLYDTSALASSSSSSE